ncbi:unnamed protein product, partial [Pleuronectes platessa]
RCEDSATVGLRRRWQTASAADGPLLQTLIEFSTHLCNSTQQRVWVCETPSPDHSQAARPNLIGPAGIHRDPIEGDECLHLHQPALAPYDPHSHSQRESDSRRNKLFLNLLVWDGGPLYALTEGRRGKIGFINDTDGSNLGHMDVETYDCV